MKFLKVMYLSILLFGGVTLFSCNNNDDCTEKTWYQDADGDRFGNIDKTTQSCTKPDGYVSNNTDCNDTDVSINPDATETPDDQIDSNCDGNDNT